MWVSLSIFLLVLFINLFLYFRNASAPRPKKDSFSFEFSPAHRAALVTVLWIFWVTLATSFMLQESKQLEALADWAVLILAGTLLAGSFIDSTGGADDSHRRP